MDDRTTLPTFYTPANVKLNQLLLDPNNYRFQDEGGRSKVAPERFHEEKVQESAYAYIKSDGLLDLKKSIQSNGFLPVERIVVKKYGKAEPDQKYVVLEGNRRLAALKWIQQEDANGVTADADLIKMMSDLPVIEVESDDESTYLSIMGVRHVGGIKEWGGYQSAKLVAELKDEHSLDTSQVASRLGLSALEVNRRYRAYKALDQMRLNEEYGDKASPDFYTLFFEAISSPRVRDWLGWEESSATFTSEDERSQFYALITPGESSAASGKVQEPKITKYLEVRELRAILNHPAALSALLDPDLSFSDASAVAKSDSSANTWRTAVVAATAALDKVGARELKKLDNSDIGLLNELVEAASSVIEAGDTSGDE